MPPNRLHYLLTLLACAVACSQIQTSSPSADRRTNRTLPPPALMSEWEDNLEPLELREVAVDVWVFGPLAETRMTLTFFNPHPEALEGELYFPLPQGATVSGYALDVEGRLVEGVVVDKHEARRVLELEARKGIDPGLVEWVKGNSFRTRVYPVPAGGSRTIRVSYVSSLIESTGDPIYHLPLGFRDRIDSLSLRIEVVQAGARPEVIDSAGLSNFTFAAWRRSFVAEQTLSNAKLTGDLRIALPDLYTQQVWVERGPDDRFYFLIRDPISAVSDGQLAASAHRIRLLWDASGSRVSADLKREIALLEQILSSPVARDADVEFVRFADRAQPAVHFAMPEQLGALVSALQATRYNGGTQLAAMEAPADAPPPDLYLVFSDGIQTFGEKLSNADKNPHRMNAPIYAINSSSSADHAFLRRLALTTGGAYFNLNRSSDERIVSEINHTGLQFLSAAAPGDAISDVYPTLPERIAGPFTLVGVLADDAAMVTLEYGSGRQVTERRRFAVERERAADSDFIARYWAASKIDELLISPDDHQQEIRELGRRYSIVTPGTSLIVLERLEQYVEHRIRPPASLPELRSAYDQQMEEIAAIEETKEVGKLERIVALWQKQVAWWETRFKYPKNFHYEEPKPRAPRLPGQTGGSVGDIEEIMICGEREYDAAESVAAFSAADLHALRIADIADLSDFTPNLEIDTTFEAAAAPAIAVETWDPKTPYLTALEAAPPERWTDVYFEFKQSHGKSPGFYLDCADFFRRRGDEAFAAEVLSNLAELALEDPALLRILAHRLAQLDQLDLAILTFEEVLALRPEEPQSARDLALVLARRADRRSGENARADYERSLELLAHVIMSDWDRFDEIELIALVEFNHILPRARKADVERIPLDERLVKALDLDIRIVMTWDSDMTDMDLHVVEPSGEKAYFRHHRTTIGGLVSRDFTDGYGPEVYMLHHAMPGTYRIEADYFGSASIRIVGAVTLQVDLVTNFGRPDEQRESLTFRLTGEDDRLTIGEIHF